jgi:hypothetical protein
MASSIVGDVVPHPVDVTGQQIIVTQTKSYVEFMKRFDSTRISDFPNENPDNFDDKKDPHWAQGGKQDFLVDPNEKIIGIWSNRAQTVSFFDHGYLRKNPDVEGDYKFCDSAKAKPYEKPKGTIFSNKNIKPFFLSQVKVKVS